ncbi:hypothetical protein ACSW8S_17070 (plasmid) [Clostridium perfringens]
MKKKNKKENTASTMYSVKVNDSVLNQFKAVYKNLGFKTLTSACIWLINSFNNNIDSDSDTTLFDLSECNAFRYSCSKKINFRVKKDLILKFTNNANLVGLSDDECFRKLMILEIKKHYVTVEPYFDLSEYVTSKSNYGVVDFGLRCNKEDLKKFLDIYEYIEKESSPTASLNDIVRQTIKLYRSDKKSLIYNLSSIPYPCVKNDYKYNFSVSNKRYLEFLKVCHNIGLAPTDCLRKSMEYYVRKNSEKTLKELKN